MFSGLGKVDNSKFQITPFLSSTVNLLNSLCQQKKLQDVFITLEIFTCIIFLTRLQCLSYFLHAHTGFQQSTNQIYCLTYLDFPVCPAKDLISMNFDQ